MNAGPATRIGVVGCGTIAYWTHLRVLARMGGRAVLVAAADPDPAARARAARLSRIQLHDSAAELLARDDLDAVVLCPPTPAHAEVALAACRRGLPFYLEKPIATCAADADAIVTAATAAGVVASIGFNRRLHPIHERARALLAAGRIGRVRTVLSASCEPAGDVLTPWRQRRASGGGALLELGSHHIDLVRWLLDDEIVAVEGRIESDASEHDSAWLRLATRGGVEVRSAFSFRSGPADWLSFIGERGSLLIDRFRCALELHTTRRFGYGQRRVPLVPRIANAGYRLRRIASPSHEPSYARALAAFVAEVRGGPARTARLADGARSLAVALAAEESARCGGPIEPAREDDADPSRH